MTNRMANNFVQLSKAKIQETRFAVTSQNVRDGGFTIAQQLVVNEGKRRTSVFMKEAMHLDSLENLYNLRDSLNEAIQIVENS